MIMGPSGRGKSTLVSSFHHFGFALLGDDAMIISGLDTIPQVRPVYPSLRLLPDSVEAIIPSAMTSNSVACNSVKQRFDVATADHISDLPLSIAAIFSLREPGVTEAITLRRSSAAKTCMALVESSFSLDPSDTAQARRRLEAASTLAAKVPAFEISYPRDYARLPEVRQAILDQVAALEPA